MSSRNPAKPTGLLRIGNGVFGNLWDPGFVSRAPSYVFQSGLDTVSPIVILLVEDSLLRAAIVVAVASSAFTILWCRIASPPHREG